MRFYNITVDIKNNPFQQGEMKRNQEKELTNKICRNTMNYIGKKYEKVGVVFFSAVSMPCLNVCVGRKEVNLNNFVEKYLEELKFDYDDIKIEETSFETFFDAVLSADRNGLIEYEKIISALSLENLYDLWDNNHKYAFSDRIVETIKTADELYADACGNYLGIRYETELKRILDGEKKEKCLGQPAHYLICSTDGKHRRLMIRDIISALYAKGRLCSCRYTLVMADGHNSAYVLENVYDANDGATVVIKIKDDDLENAEFKRNECDIEKICETVKANSARVLTIFSVESWSEKVKEKLKNELSGVALVDISENLFEKESAVEVLEDLAQKDDVQLPCSLVEKIRESERVYDLNTLASIYGKWRHEYLSTTVFPEYKTFFTHEIERTQEKQSDAYFELQEMIGLSAVKKIVNEAINYFSLQNEYRLRGISFHRPSMHMVFTGSPGTAKTSVARLIARILREKEILSVGKLIEVGRADIIGQYVGQTAPLVKSVFNKAKGSVLFIDEAYSLVDDKKGLYGDEAINTIVQEMENHRDDVIVIFAGYKDEMDCFLERNPGLNSRVAFHVPFDDYTENELLDITKLLARKTGYTIEDGADEKLLSIFKKAKTDASFGNGRFARNLLEKAKFTQANRIAVKDLRFVSDRELTTLNSDDFTDDCCREMQRKIGFSA